VSLDWLAAVMTEPVQRHARFPLQPGSADTQTLLVSTGRGWGLGMSRMS